MTNSVYLKVEKIRKLLNPEIVLAVKEIRDEYIQQISEQIQIDFVERIENLTIEFENLGNLKSSIFDSLTPEELNGTISRWKGWLNNETSLNYKYLECANPDLLKRFNHSLQIINAQIASYNKVKLYHINSSSINSHINKNTKISTSTLKTLRVRIENLEDILNVQSELIFPLRNAYIKKIEFYNLALGKTRSCLQPKYFNLIFELFEFFVSSN
jgi:hypothetical protein